MTASYANSRTQAAGTGPSSLLATLTGRAYTPAGKQTVRSDEYNVLAETLRGMRLSGSVFVDARFSKPFAVANPVAFEAGTPLAHLRHVSIFHLIASGSCTIEVETGERYALSAGDIVMLPFAAAHKIWSGDHDDVASAPALMSPGTVEGIWTISHGGGGEATRMVCGFIDSQDFLYSPLLHSLPSLLVERSGDDRISALIATTLREILLAEAPAPGTALILERMLELLFVEVVRRYAERMPPSTRSWFAACNDPIVGRALQAIHRNTARRWTVHALAREIGTSRSALSERFTAMVGKPPIEYLAGWRMHLAAKRLRDTDDCLAAVAAEIGYDSESAFNRAFKRIAGLAPGRWRELSTHRSLAGATR